MRVGWDFRKLKNVSLSDIHIHLAVICSPTYTSHPLQLNCNHVTTFTLFFPFSMFYGIIHSRSITPIPPAAFLILCAASSKFNDIRFSLNGTGPGISSAVKNEVEYPVVTEK